MSIKIVTESNIKEILQSNKIIFLDFWGSSCGPCKNFAPIYEKVAMKHTDLFFGAVNSEVEHLLCEDFEIKAVPTLVILKEGTIIYSESGAIPEYALNNIVENARKIDITTLEKEDV